MLFKSKIPGLAIIAVCCAFVLTSACNKSNEGAYYSFKNSNAVFDGNTYQFLQAQNGLYDSLLYVINKVSGLKDTVSNYGITLFAVTNQSFAIALQNMNAQRQALNEPILYLSTVDSTQLDTLICRYILPGKIVTDSINSFSSGSSYASFRYDYGMHLRYNRQDAMGYQNGGPQQIEFSDEKNSIFERFWITTFTTSVNIHTTNGIVHLVSPGHEFGFGEFARRMNKADSVNLVSIP